MIYFADASIVLIIETLEPLHWCVCSQLSILYLNIKINTNSLIRDIYEPLSGQFSSIAQSCLTLWPHGLQHTRLSCSSVSPGICSNSCPLSHWSHPTILSSVTLFSSCLQSFPESRSFPISWCFTSCGKVLEL